MDNAKTFIIISDEEKAADAKLCEVLRCCGVSYMTGRFDGCIWYLTNQEISFGSLSIGWLIGCHYKMMSTDYCSFECNCNDTDLPIIEDVFDVITNWVPDWGNDAQRKDSN